MDRQILIVIAPLQKCTQCRNLLWAYSWFKERTRETALPYTLTYALFSLFIASLKAI